MRRSLCLWLLLFSAVSAHSQPSSSPWSVEADRVVHATCGKEVALLGESPLHSFADALEFKTEIVRRLVTECHFRALLFESSMYDFAHMEGDRAAGHDVSDSMIAAAIGGLWANQEVQSLIPFLRERANAGTLLLGGLDDQIGAGSYASREMAADLAEPLAGEEKSRCFDTFQKHLLWQYTDKVPYGPADKQAMLGCLDRVEAKQSTGFPHDTGRAMAESFRRNLARNFTEDDFSHPEQEVRWMNDRDRSMYLNFQWLMSGLPRGSKVIVWAASVHTAKTLNGIQGLEGRVPLGSFLQADYGHRSFVLGFSAFSGESQFTHHPVQHLADAPAASLEGKAFASNTSSAVYFSEKQLRKSGSMSARVLSADFKTAQWNRVLDGLVVFRTEHPPTWLRR